MEGTFAYKTRSSDTVQDFWWSRLGTPEIEDFWSKKVTSHKSEILPQFRTRRSSIPDTIVSAVTQGGVKNGSFMIFREDDIESYTNRYDLILLQPNNFSSTSNLANSTLGGRHQAANHAYHRKKPRRSCPHNLKFSTGDHYIEV